MCICLKSDLNIVLGIQITRHLQNIHLVELCFKVFLDLIFKAFLLSHE